MIDVVKDDSRKELRILISGTFMNHARDDQIVALLDITESLRTTFDRIVPGGWKVIA